MLFVNLWKRCNINNFNIVRYLTTWVASILLIIEAPCYAQKINMEGIWIDNDSTTFNFTMSEKSQVALEIRDKYNLLIWNRSFRGTYSDNPFEVSYIL